MKSKLMVIDGSFLIYRSYYQGLNSPHISKNDMDVSVAYGFFNSIISILLRYAPTHIAISLDYQGDSFRKALYPEYKANRNSKPDEIIYWHKELFNILSKTGISVFSVPGYEGDDVIATICKHALDSQYFNDIIIYAQDKDFFQCITDRVSMIRPVNGNYAMVDRQFVKDIYGIYPEQVVGFLSLVGDSSDNIPGVPGVGERTASKLLNTYTDIDGLYGYIDSEPNSDYRTIVSLRNSKDLVYRNLQLVKLDTSVNIDVSNEEICTSRISYNDINIILDSFNFNDLKYKFNRYYNG